MLVSIKISLRTNIGAVTFESDQFTRKNCFRDTSAISGIIAILAIFLYLSLAIFPCQDCMKRFPKGRLTRARDKNPLLSSNCDATLEDISKS